MTREQAIEVLKNRYYSGVTRSRTDDEWRLATDTAIAALREKAERGRGCAYCVIGRRSPDARYCSNCGRKLTPALPELANESRMALKHLSMVKRDVDDAYQEILSICENTNTKTESVGQGPEPGGEVEG